MLSGPELLYLYKSFPFRLPLAYSVNRQVGHQVTCTVAVAIVVMVIMDVVQSGSADVTHQQSTSFYHDTYVALIY
jgi:hypothetical protein